MQRGPLDLASCMSVEDMMGKAYSAVFGKVVGELNSTQMVPDGIAVEDREQVQLA